MAPACERTQIAVTNVFARSMTPLFNFFIRPANTSRAGLFEKHLIANAVLKLGSQSRPSDRKLCRRSALPKAKPPPPEREAKALRVDRNLMCEV